ncbi:MAG: polysaccharide deacetylase family protein [Flavobacteriales bacterium]
MGTCYTKYQEVRRFQKDRYGGGGLRPLLRDRALDLFSKGYRISGRLKKGLEEPRVQFIYLHHCFEDEVKGLRTLLETLKQDHEFISYSRAVEMLLNGARIDRPYIAFSSDDGFRNNLKMASVMEDLGARCCFFLVPELVGAKDPDFIEKTCAERFHFPPVEFMDGEDVKGLLENGHEIGSHSFSHPNMAGLSLEEGQRELRKGKEELEAAFGPVRHFAWPYGRFFHFRAELAEASFEAGYRSCASAERGAHLPAANGSKPEELCIRRDHVILDWPLDHTLFFLARNGIRVAEGKAANTFPYYGSE